MEVWLLWVGDLPCWSSVLEGQLNESLLSMEQLSKDLFLVRIVRREGTVELNHVLSKQGVSTPTATTRYSGTRAPQ